MDSPSFIPNWKRLGKKTREEGVAYILDYLKKCEKTILKGSLTNSATFMLGDIVFTMGNTRHGSLDKKEKKEKK